MQQRMVLLLFIHLAFAYLEKEQMATSPSTGCKKHIDETLAGNFHHVLFTSTNPSFDRSNNAFYQIMRDYYVYIPRKYREPRPLVMNLHGYFNTAAQQISDGWVDVAVEQNLFIVYPNGFGDLGGKNFKNVTNDPRYQSWNIGSHFFGENCLSSAQEYCYNSCAALGYCNYKNDTCTATTCMNDKFFIAQEVLSRVLADYCIDINSVYLSGWSNGGVMVFSFINILLTSTCRGQ